MKCAHCGKEASKGDWLCESQNCNNYLSLCGDCEEYIFAAVPHKDIYCKKHQMRFRRILTAIWGKL